MCDLLYSSQAVLISGDAKEKSLLENIQTRLKRSKNLVICDGLM